MSKICPICRGYFNPPEDWDKAVCPSCYTSPEEQIKPQEPEDKDESMWVVVFLGVDSPKELKQFKGKDKAQAFANAVYDGIKGLEYLKGSERIRVWKAEALDNREGRTVIAVGTLDGIRAEEFDQGEYI